MSVTRSSLLVFAAVVICGFASLFGVPISSQASKRSASRTVDNKIASPGLAVRVTWDFGDRAFSYLLFGAPVKGEEKAGSRSSVYRFHLDSPIPFTKSIRATIEHGHANHRSDNFYSVAYWYQTEPHAAFPQLPPLDQRLLKLFPV